MNLGFYILFLVMLTTMTILLEEKTPKSSLLNIPRFTIVIMSLFHLLKELFQIWDEVSRGSKRYFFHNLFYPAFFSTINFKYGKNWSVMAHPGVVKMGHEKRFLLLRQISVGRKRQDLLCRCC